MPDDPRPVIAAALRRERERAGLSQSELARRASVAKSTLSQLEAGTGNPGVETLWALATALGITFSRLVEPPPDEVRLVRAGEGPRTEAERASYSATLLSSAPPGTRRDLYRLTAEPGRARRSDPHPEGTVEHLVLATGRALAGPVADPVELGPGDYLRYPGDAPHVFDALEPGTSAVLVSES